MVLKTPELKKDPSFLLNSLTRKKASLHTVEFY